MGNSLKVFSDKDAKFLLVLAKRIVPDIATLPETEQLEVVCRIDDALWGREPALRMQFLAFLKILKLSFLPRHLKTFDRIKPAQQDDLIRKFEDHSIGKLRSGIWGVRTLIFMGYYGNPGRAKQFHYTPSLNGNEKLHAK
jgi:hypothetical protein